MKLSIKIYYTEGVKLIVVRTTYRSVMTRKNIFLFLNLLYGE